MTRILLLLCALTTQVTFAQEFETSLYFENSLGQKDTLVVGYDSAANNGLNDEFDSDCLEDFSNENFGVWIWDNNSNYLPTVDEIESNLVNWSKKNIVKKSCNVDRGIARMMIPTENLPLTLRWDQSIFTEGCHDEILMGFGFSGGADTGCWNRVFLREVDSLIIDEMWLSPLVAYCQDGFTFLEMNDTTKFLNASFEVRSDDFIGVGGINNQVVNQIEVYPNPTNGLISFPENSNFESLKVFDLYGREIPYEELGSILFIRHRGLVFINAIDYSGQLFTARVLID